MAQTYATTVRATECIAEGTLLVRMEKPEGFTYRGGQTIELALPRGEGEPLVHTFSLVTAPHEEELAIATRLRDSAYKQALSELWPGSPLEIEGPYGSFFLHADATRPAVFLVGGIGITPFKSMIEDARERDLKHDIYLFYSNHRPEDAAFLPELEQIAEIWPQLHLIPTMTDIKHSERDWSGETGYVTWEMVQKYVPAEAAPVYYMAGPQGMVAAMQRLLAEQGVSEDDIRFEEFSGY